MVALEAIIAGMIYRTMIWITTPSMVGMDPDKYAVAISVISDEGIVAISDLGFYGSTQIYHIFNLIMMIVLGSKPEVALQMSTTVFFSVIPVATVGYLAKMLSGDQAAKLGCVLASAGAASITYATLTIPQGTMVILWYLISIILINDKNDSRYTILLVIFITIMSGLHKLGALLALGAISSIAVLKIINTARNGQVQLPAQFGRYAVIAGLIFSIQMVWVTAWIKGVIVKILYIVGRGPPEITTETPAAAKIGGLNVIFEHGSWIVLVLLAGITGLWLISKRTDYQTTGILGISGLSVLLIIGAATTPFSLSIQRAIGIAEPFVIVLAVVGIVALSKRTNRSIAPIFVGLLLITQLGSAGAVPDHPTEIREYLTNSEIDAKEWANTHIDQEIYAHYFVAQEIIDYDNERATYKTGEGGGFSKGWSPVSEYLVTGSLENADGCVLLRKDQSFIRYDSLYELSYDPFVQLNRSNRTKVFENSNTSIYC
ncbi:hypothetical protein [Halalkalicoccus paucihalophilus]|nr:hypothetical protein [Halalkalicoccus paucihalophilus]